MARGIILLIIAATLDALQVIIGVGFAGISTTATGIVQFIPILGQAAGAVSMATGAVLGYVEDTALSVGFGTLIVTLLMYSKMFYPGPVLMSYVAETVPVVNIFPCWTALVARSLYLTYKIKQPASPTDPYAQTAKSGPVTQGVLRTEP